MSKEEHHQAPAPTAADNIIPAPYEVGYLWSGMAHLAIPHRQNRQSINEFGELERSVGNRKLILKPIIAPNPETGERTRLPFPSGSIPRLLMMYVVSEAKKSGDPYVALGASLREFMQRIGLTPDRGGERSDRARLDRELPRFLGTSFEYTQVNISPDNPNHKQVGTKLFTPIQESQIWYDTSENPNQLMLEEGYVKLGRDFFDEIDGMDAHAFPVLKETVRQLQHASLALDIYTFLTFKSFQRQGKPYGLTLHLDELMALFGAEYKPNKGGRSSFKNNFVKQLSAVQAVYPGLKVRWDQRPGDLTLLPGSKPDVTQRIISATKKHELKERRAAAEARDARQKAVAKTQAAARALETKNAEAKKADDAAFANRDTKALMSDGAAKLRDIKNQLHNQTTPPTDLGS